MRSRALRDLTVGAALLLLCAGAARSAERYELQPRFREGQSWSFEQRGELQQSSTTSAPGQPPQQLQQTMRQMRTGSVVVLAVNDGMPTSIRITFGSDCATEMQVAGRKQPVAVPFAGQTVTVTRDARGQVQHDFKGAADPSVLEELTGYLPATRDSFPPRPLAIGEEWEPDTAALRQSHAMGPQDHLSVKARLVAIRDFDGRRVAEIETTWSITKQQGEGQMQNDVRGTSLVDLDTGNTLRSQFAGTSSMRGSQQMQQPGGQAVTVQMQSEGSSRMQFTARPLDEAPRTNSPSVSVAGSAPPAGPSPRAQTRTGPTATAVAAADTAGFVRFRKISVQDRPEGIGGEAFTFLCPVDWRVEGGLIWREHPVMPATTHLRAFNPRGLEQLESLPTLGFSWGGMLQQTGFPPGSMYYGNEVRPPVRDAAQYITDIILPRYRGAVQLRITGSQELPEWGQAVATASELEQLAMTGVQAGCSAGKVRVEYEVDGQPVEEDFYVALVTTVLPGGMGPLYTQSGERVHAMRAAKGQLDSATRIMQTMVTSIRQNLQWFSTYNQLCATLREIEMGRIRTAGRISEIISQTSSEIGDMQMESWNRRNASEDRISKAWSQVNRGVEEYYSPIEQRPIELPSGYTDAWVNAAGEYVVSDNANFDPNVELNGSWQRLQRAGN